MTSEEWRVYIRECMAKTNQKKIGLHVANCLICDTMAILNENLKCDVCAGDWVTEKDLVPFYESSLFDDT